MSSIRIIPAEPAQISLIQELTLQVWPQTYQHILTPEQIDYMLQLMYSTEALQEQMKEGHRFFIAWQEEMPLGFASYSPSEMKDEYKLHKLYVRTDVQKTGAGKALLWFVLEEVKQQNAHHLVLQVNRSNEKAIGFYLKMGFRIEHQYDFHIGNGFYMNDYIMGIRL